MRVFYYGSLCENADSSKKQGRSAKTKIAGSGCCQPFRQLLEPPQIQAQSRLAVPPAAVATAPVKPAATPPPGSPPPDPPGKPEPPPGASPPRPAYPAWP